MPSEYFTPAPQPEKLNKKWYKKWWLWFLIVIGLYLAVSFMVLGFSSEGNVSTVDLPAVTQLSRDELLKNAFDDPSSGPTDAPVYIVEFGDFQCPFCRQSFPVVRELLKEFGDKIYFVYRDFPVGSIHPEALKAAEAAECAEDQDKFWVYHDKLFINQENLKLADLKRYAIEVGLAREVFNDCLDSGIHQSEIELDYEDGIKFGVIGTPTFFINGYRVPGSIPKDIFIKIIEQALQEAL